MNATRKRFKGVITNEVILIYKEFLIDELREKSLESIWFEGGNDNLWKM